MKRSVVTPRLLIVLFCLTMVGSTTGVFAHDIPNDITIQVYVKPEGQRLQLLVRVPLNAMRDMSFPLLGPGYLDLAQADAELRNAAILWIGDEIKLFEDGVRLPNPNVVAVRASIPSDPSFRRYEDALSHIMGPRLPDRTQLFWQQALLDVLFEIPIQSDQADYMIDPGLERLGLRVVTVLRFLPPGKDECVYEYVGSPGTVPLDPHWYQAALRFSALGFTHILDGFDHLLFLLCLVIPFRQIRALIAVVTAFTVAHSITLIASAFGLAPDTLWFPPVVETLIAASIVYMALENIIGAQLHRRWLITFGFGLIHGFGFSFALRETLQFGGTHLLTSLLAFNVGVELGQILVLLLLIPALALLYRFGVRERMATIILSVLVAHTGWHWMTDRAAVLSQYDMVWPTLDLSLLLSATGWLLLIMALAGLSWWALGMRRQVKSAD
ncbi:MAG: HupE/UreJ family protein [Gemmatimonadota bacterium]|nr:HupE/UreJ family protein [Gemmatimonadota bacterium]